MPEIKTDYKSSWHLEKLKNTCQKADQLERIEMFQQNLRFLNRWFQRNLAAHGLLWFWQLPLLWRPLSVLNPAFGVFVWKSQCTSEIRLSSEHLLLQLQGHRISCLPEQNRMQRCATMHRSMCSDLFETRNAANTEHFSICSCHFIESKKFEKLSCQQDQPLKTQRWKLFTSIDISKCNQWIFTSHFENFFRKVRSACLQVSTTTRLWSRPWVHSGPFLSILWARIHSVNV